MNKLIICCIIFTVSETCAQQKLWTESDRTYLLSNLIRSRDELMKETEHLSEKQWRFKESSDRWSINEVLEHLAIYEILFQRQINMSIRAGAQAEMAKQVGADSTFLNFVLEAKPHATLDYTVPFTYASPMGLTI